MSDEERRRQFAEAFIAQARSDWQVYRLLSQSVDIPSCHGLHYLQMTCEKLAKAYRLRDVAADVNETITRHTGFTNFIGPFFLALKDEYVGKDAQLTRLIRESRKLAREIEKMAPAIDRAAAPENAEYPWEANGRVTAPCNYSFPALSLLQQSGGRAFLNFLQRALRDFEALSIR